MEKNKGCYEKTQEGHLGRMENGGKSNKVLRAEFHHPKTHVLKF